MDGQSSRLSWAISELLDNYIIIINFIIIGRATRVIQLVYYLVVLSLSLAWHFHLIDCRRTLHTTQHTHDLF